jgi:hypothetical protein
MTMRARNIKPGFFTNETLADLDPLVRILFAGLWCLADRSGRLEDRPRRIRAEIFPHHADTDVEGMLEALVVAGFILRYTAPECPAIQVVNFQKHQNPHKREAISKITPPAESDYETTTTKARPSTVPAQDKAGPRPGISTQKAMPSPADSGFSDSLIPKEQEHPPQGPQQPPAAPASKPATATPPQERKRGTRLPADWKPHPGVVAAMAVECPEVEQLAELRRFHDYWEAKPGKDAVKTNWDATYRNWIRTANERRVPRGPNRAQGPAGMTKRAATLAAMDATADELERRARAQETDPARILSHDD